MCCVLSSTQGFAPLKPSDVAAMVNHRDKVGYGCVITYPDANRKARPRSGIVHSSDQSEQ